MLRLFLILSFSWVSYAIFAQNPYFYKFSYRNQSYAPLTNATTVNNRILDSGAVEVANIGFPFTIDNKRFTQVRIAHDGYLSFDSTITRCATYVGFSNNTDQHPIIAPFWSKFRKENSTISSVKYTIQGSSPNRVFIVEWKNFGWVLDTSKRISFQVKLYETTNVFEFHYGHNLGTYYLEHPRPVMGFSTGSFWFHTAHAQDWGVGSVYNGNYYSDRMPNNGQIATYTPPNCILPPYYIDSITDRSARVRWSKPDFGQAIRYNWAYKIKYADHTEISGRTTDTVFRLANLAANNTYQFALGATCANGDTTKYEFGYEFKTEQLKLPYFEGFEVDSIRPPLGWENWGWRVGTKSPDGRLKAAEGRNFAYCNFPDGLGKSFGLYNIKAGSRPPRLTYKYKILGDSSYAFEGGQAPLIVRIGKEIANDTPTTYKYFREPTTNFTTWQTQSIDLIGYENTNISVFFTAYLRDTNALVAIDSVVLENAPNCLIPNNVTVNPITKDSVIVAWTAVSGQTQWEIEYGLRGFPIGQGNRVVANNKTYVLKNLQGGQTYDFYVRTVCSTTDKSPWSFKGKGTVPVNTLINSFPHYDAFDSIALSSTWLVETNVDTLRWKAVYYNPNIDLSKVLTPANGRGFVRLSIPYSRVESYLQAPAFQLDNVSKQLSYHYYNFSNCENILTVEISLDRLNWQILNSHDCYTDNVKVGGSYVWRKKTLSLANYRNKTVFIRFKVDNKHQDDSYFGIDDFLIENTGNTCLAPTDLSSSGLQKNDIIELAWTKGNTETNWEVEYGTPNFKIGTGTRTLVTGDINRLVLRGVQFADKEFYVRAVCGTNTYSRWTGPVSTTSVDVSIKALSAYHLAGVNTDSGYIDWKMLALKRGNFSSTFGVFAGFNEYGYWIGGSRRRIYNHIYTDVERNNLTILNISPRLLNLRAKTHQLSFIVKGRTDANSDKKLTVGVMSSRLDSSSFTPIQTYTIPNDEVFQKKTISFANYNLDKEFLAFRWESPGVHLEHQTNITIDSIEWERIPTCAMPINVTVDTVKIAHNAVTVSWKRGNTPLSTTTGFNWIATKYDSPFASSLNKIEGNPFVKNPLRFGTTTADTVRFSGLEPNTQYDVFVQSFCTNGNDTSTYWTNATKFRTAAINDICNNALPIDIANGWSTPTFSDALPQPVYPSTVRTDNITCVMPSEAADMWYYFVTPNRNDKPLHISLYRADNRIIASLALYRGNCNNLIYEGCKNYQDWIFDHELEYILTNYTPNTTYYIRVFKNDFPLALKLAVQCGNSNDCILDAPPSNDLCRDASPLFNGKPQKSYFNLNTATLEPNFSNDPACETNLNIQDVWYRFRTEGDNYRMTSAAIKVKNLFDDAVRYAVYKGTCGNLVRISDCFTVNGRTTSNQIINCPEANQEYFVRVWADNNFSGEFEITLNALNYFGTTQVANAVTTTNCQPFYNFTVDNTNKNSWITLQDGTGVVAEINANGNILGQVTGGYYINSTGTLRRASGTPYFDRNIGIKVTTQPATPVTIRLYFTERERAAYFAVVGANPIVVTHYSGALCFATVSNGNGEAVPAIVKIAPNGNYYAEFNTTRFSGFFLGNKGLVFTDDIHNSFSKLIIENIYPNPVTNELSVVVNAFESNDKGKIQIFDVLGQIVYIKTISVVADRNTLIVNTADLPKGAYFIKITEGGYSAVRKFVKQ
jgi:Secretion system C-terminal sorting domain/Fibronectin type III domain